MWHAKLHTPFRSMKRNSLLHALSLYEVFNSRQILKWTKRADCGTLCTLPT